jgi:hypothetical protein
VQLQVENDTLLKLQRPCLITRQNWSIANSLGQNKAVLAPKLMLAMNPHGAILTCMGKRLIRAFLILLAAAMAALPGLSGSAFALSMEEHNRTGLRDCDCRAQGALWRQGQELCINGQMQVCTMDQNVSAWKPVGRVCPSARLFTPRPLAKL